MAKPHYKILIAIVFTLLILGGWWWRQQSQVVPPIQQVTETETEPSPTPAPEVIVLSPDGKIELTLKQQPSPDSTVWNLIAKQENKEPKTIWKSNLPKEAVVTLSPNTVSPDNKYLFLRQDGPDDQVSYWAMTTSGERISKTAATVEFGSLFATKYPDYRITEVTGWGGINLIVINTNELNGDLGPSFWFEIPSQNFIYLSNRFN